MEYDAAQLEGVKVPLEAQADFRRNIARRRLVRLSFIPRWKRGLEISSPQRRCGALAGRCRRDDLLHVIGVA